MADAKPYIATAPLFVDGVRAHNAGDRVPDDNVKRNGWEDSVAREGTKAAEAAVADAPTAGLPVAEQSPQPK